MKRNRIDFEKRALKRMIFIYCKGHKHDGPLCGDCQLLLDYALKKLDLCRFGNEKTFCSKCTVHCYKPAMRDQIRKVMRFSGPRMLYHAPLTALKHLLRK